MNINSIIPTPSVALAEQANILKAEGKKIIELQTGDPDFDTHPDIISATNKALLSGETHYSFSAGLPLLRECIAYKMNNEFEINLTLSNIIITQGAVQAMYAVLTTLIEFSDEVIVLEPNWTTVDSIITACGGQARKVSHLVEDNELFNSLNQCLTQKTKVLCINSPCNPTGTVFSAQRTRSLVAWCKQHDLYLVSDEVYRSIIFNGSHTSVMTHYTNNNKVIFIDSFSKKYSMTGWRVGYIVAHLALIEKIKTASQIQITHVAPFIQIGALEALQNEAVNHYVLSMNKQYLARKKRLVSVCKQLGLKIIDPQGAFYLFIYIGQDDVLYSKKLLLKYNICVVPGSAYGESGKKHIRLTFATHIDKVVAALQVISQTLVTKNINE